MKLKTLKIKKYPLLNLYILKYARLITSKISINIKYLLRFIYEYHINKKTILFVGLKYSKKLNNADLKNHILLPKHLLNNGVLSNKKYLKNKTSKLFTTKNPNLVVIFNAEENDINFITELLKLNIPIILCGYNSKTIEQCLNNSKQIYLFGLNLTETQLSFYKFLIHSIILKKF